MITPGKDPEDVDRRQGLGGCVWDGRSGGGNRGAASRGQALGEGSEIQLARPDGGRLNGLGATAQESPWRILSREINHHKALFGPIMMYQVLA